jgi:hypothetical protein
LHGFRSIFFTQSPSYAISSRKGSKKRAILTPKCNFSGFDQVCVWPLSLNHRPEQKISKYGGSKMIQKLGNKLQVQIDSGEDKPKKVSFPNVIDEPTEEAVLELGAILTELSPAGSALDGVILTSQSRYTK